ncbi:MAG: sigma-54 dependent transcriptional regulator [Pseudomonadota bacterium]
MTHRVLLVEDEQNYRQVIAMMIADLDVTLIEAGDGREALEKLDSHEVDLIITDLNMPRMDGMALLAELKTRQLNLPVVVITAYGTVDSAVEAMRLGAIDYLQKPFEEARLRLTLQRVLQVSDLMAENRRLRDAVEKKFDFSQIIGESAAMVAALRVAGQVAGTDATVLVEGESGTGKELVARAIHFNSRRARKPFVAVNCAALPDTLLEAELFGSEVGAYTGATRRRRGRVELAQGGTLFLDEIGDMPAMLQAKILRLIQEKTYTPLGGEQEARADVRFVLATHRDLKSLVAEGRFREDLYYRVSGLPVRLPPLRQRGDDVVLLAEALIKQACQNLDRPPLELTPAARDALRGYGFPGNVRELANLVERATLLSEGTTIDATDLELDDNPASAPAAGSVPGASTTAVSGVFTLPEQGVSLEELERSMVKQALDRAAGNKSRAAKLLGLSRATLRYRIEKFGLE